MRVDGLSPIETGAAAQTAEVDPKLREAALQFEELLVRQLTQSLTESAQGSDEESSVASNFYADQLPGVLASAIKDAGGLGLADELERAMRIGQ
jgi:Rod binding domain-containing protein